MSITQKTVFITSNGEQFDTLVEAEREERAIQLGQAIEDQFSFCYGSDARAVARWILERYELRPDQEAP